MDHFSGSRREKIKKKKQLDKMNIQDL